MAHRSTSSSSRAEANASERSGEAGDTGAWDSTPFPMLGAQQLFTQWMVQAQQMQSQMLRAWMQTVDAVSAQQPALAPWAEMQSRWVGQMQDQMAQTVRLLGQQGERVSGAPLPFQPTELFRQAQSTFDALTRQWQAALKGMIPRE